MSAEKIFEYKKSPDERRTFTVWFEPQYPDTEAFEIAAVETLILNSQNVHQSAMFVSNTFLNDKMQFTVKDGVNGQDYKIKAKATMTNGEILVASGILKVYEF